MNRDEHTSAIRACNMIIDDAQTDAAKPVPFTPLGVGTIHGEMLAMISTLALILKQVLETVDPEAWSHG